MKLKWLYYWNTPNIHTLIQIQHYRIQSSTGMRDVYYFVLFGIGISLTSSAKKRV